MSLGKVSGGYMSGGVLSCHRLGSESYFFFIGFTQSTIAEISLPDRKPLPTLEPNTSTVRDHFQLTFSLV